MISKIGKIRSMYGVPARIGGRIFFIDHEKFGTIKSTNGTHLRIRIDGESRSKCFHPTYNLIYLPTENLLTALGLSEKEYVKVFV